MIRTATSAPAAPTSGRAVGQHGNEGDDHGHLRQRVIGGIGAEHAPVHDLDQPPRQRRQLVVAELPFAAVGQGLDQVERQVGVEQRRKRGPDHEVQGEEGGERGPRVAFHRIHQSSHTHCAVGPPFLRRR